MKASVDKASVAGLFIGLTGIIGGLLLEGGKISQILQPTAAMIVFGGTAGAVLLQFSLAVVTAALRNLARVFLIGAQTSKAGSKCWCISPTAPAAKVLFASILNSIRSTIRFCAKP
jgi:hypothetical protein